MSIAVSKRQVVFAILVVVILVNVILQNFISEDEGHSGEEEKLLAKIRAKRQELNRLEAAEELLRKDSANFAHPDVLKSLHIDKTETNLLEVHHPDIPVEDNLRIVKKTPVKNTAPPTQAPTIPASSSTKTKEISAATGNEESTTYHLMSSVQDVSTSTSTDNIMVVGGTDGSGTRRVVQLLTRLGVTIVSEDPETYDIHADLFGGWPQVVTPVLQSSGSIVADPESYPKALKNTVTSSLSRLIQKAAVDAMKPQSNKLAVGGALNKPKGAHASRVKFGFKAPVAMTLVPWWLALADKLMFLHVIRDGRDIAFSANQGPVNKFYGPMYAKKISDVPTGGAPAKAIKLWSDWNNGLRSWAEEKIKFLGRQDSSMLKSKQQFDYMKLHIEDLVHESDMVRLNAITRVAKFVGSDLDDDSLCCLAVEGSTFMGSHDRAGKIGSSGESQLKSKYGKWKAKFKADPNLENSLMKWGKNALKDLGYLNMEEYYENIEKEFSKRIDGKYQCKLTKVQCLAKGRGVKDWKDAKLKRYTPADGADRLCAFDDNVDYRGGRKMAVDISSLNTANPDECCRRCQSVQGCKFFTYVESNNVCYLKKQQGTRIADESTFGFVSGAMK